MSPVTHFLASWTLGDGLRLRGRDLALVAWCGVLPDADGLGVVVDGANRLLGRPGTWYYGEYHHVLLHGLFAAILIPLLLSIFAVNRLRMFAVGILAVHVHLLCDLVGSRGPGVDDFWPLPYMAPFSERWTAVWSGQWELNAWPNIVFSLLLIGFAFYRAVRSGYSPVGAISPRIDRVFVETVQARWRRIRGKAST